ncbi:S-layer homology domain-containing protein, partial [Oscillibacter sp.]|uniref:S-layer homology domain-containing protein n=1 Tax=Oscillibacter sp. TaxID=1945593 RepID=UPI002D7E5453
VGAVLFDPPAPCTRGTAMDFLWRYAGSPEASAPGAFTDVAPNAPYAQAVAWAVERGITSGTSETTFSPGETCTRGQIATFLYRCLSESVEKVPLPEEPIPQTPAGSEPEERVQPLRSYAGTGMARSLGLDGSEFTSAGEYEAEVAVDVYSPYEAVFTIKTPFPLYQACAYTVRFEDPESPGKGYHFTCFRRDEAFSDLLPWVGDSVQFLFSDMSGEQTRADYTAALQEEGRTDGVLSWRVVFTNGSGNFTYDLLEGLRLSCRVDANQVPAG